MPDNPLRKNKVNLSEYPYQKDIQYRLLMAELTVFEVEVISEILISSLKITISHLADLLEVDEAKLLPTLKELKKMKLYKLEGETIHVDKEMRKYYDSQIPKFDDDFRADMEYLRGLLSNPPIHVLPLWYSIPRTSDDIFSSIIEKYLLTPKVYLRYLDELSFDDPMLNKIMNDLFSTPDFIVRAKSLIEKYSLDREKFEEYMLLLEFNLICCLSYGKREGKWEEVITPFYEWRQFLRNRRDSMPKLIENTTEIVRTHPSDFGFVQDMTKILAPSLNKPLALVVHENEGALSKKTAQRILPHLDSHTLTDKYLQKLVTMLQHLKLAEVKENMLHPCKVAKTWLDKHLQEQAISVYRYSSQAANAIVGGYGNRNQRETERCLKKNCNTGWVYFEDFVKACTAPIGNNQTVSLQRKGKRWKYKIPEYTQEDIDVLYSYIFENLFYAGKTATGTHNGKPCLCLTPFGRMTLD
ncbi:MAG: hypothetical protein K940chlam7_02098 [Chlamydiae bacterium]|nr:hypothetical protein [Chlamydiota bacterium]